jgi:hypothetical protein
MYPHAWCVDDIALPDDRHTIESSSSQLEQLGVARLHARSNDGFALKVSAAQIALVGTNMDEQST